MRHPHQDTIDRIDADIKQGITPSLKELDFIMRIVYAQQRVMETGDNLIQILTVESLKKDIEIHELKQQPLENPEES